MSIILKEGLEIASNLEQILEDQWSEHQNKRYEYVMI